MDAGDRDCSFPFDWRKVCHCHFVVVVVATEVTVTVGIAGGFVQSLRRASSIAVIDRLAGIGDQCLLLLRRRDPHSLVAEGVAWMSWCLDVLEHWQSIFAATGCESIHS